MSSPDLRSVGITFVDPAEYRLLKPEHTTAQSSNAAAVIAERDGRVKAAEAQAKAWADQMTSQELKSLIEKASDVYYNKAMKDPVYAQVYSVYKAANDAYSKALDKGVTDLGTGFIGLSIAIAIDKQKGKKLDAARMAACKASIPDDVLLSKAVNKHASGMVAEYAKVYPYYQIQKTIENREGYTHNADERAFLQSDPRVQAGIARYMQVNHDAYQTIHRKYYDQKMAELTKAAGTAYNKSIKAVQAQTEVYRMQDGSEVIELIKKLVTAPAAMKGMVDFAYNEFKKRDNGMDKGVHVALIEYSIEYKVNRDRITFYYESKYSNPLSDFVFEENNYKLLTSDAQCCAVALVLGQTLYLRLKNDPVYEMADISAGGDYSLIKFRISYPNPNHTEAISLF